MSRRFGRQRQKKLLAQLSQIESQRDKAQQSAKDFRVDLEYANQIIQRTANVLGEYFVSLPVKTTEVEEIQRRYQLDLNRPRHEFNYAHAGMNAPLRMLSFTLDYLDTYQASIHTDELRRLVHMRYQSINGQVAYGFTDAAWTMLSEHVLVPLKTKFIAEEMAKLLVKERKAKGNSRYMEILL